VSEARSSGSQRSSVVQIGSQIGNKLSFVQPISVSLRLLRAFVAVSRERNVRRAAAVLYVSQPSLSQDIRRLEHQVGVPIFVRGSQGMLLTTAGEELFRNVETALALIDRGVEQARRVAATSKACLLLAFSPSVGNRLIPGLIPLLEQRLPSLIVDEREVDTGEVGPGVRDRRFDIGFAHCPTPESGLVTTLLLEEQMCAAVASSHRVASEPALHLAELNDLDLLLWPRDTAPDYYDRILAICHHAGVEPRVVQGARRALMRSYLLSEGRGFCPLPASTSVLRVPGVTFVPVQDEGSVIPLMSIRREDDQRPEILAVEEIARDLSTLLLRAS
jgi:DNA-binding transcriptional LysR family regulator